MKLHDDIFSAGSSALYSVSQSAIRGKVYLYFCIHHQDKIGETKRYTGT